MVMEQRSSWRVSCYPEEGRYEIGRVIIDDELWGKDVEGFRGSFHEARAILNSIYESCKDKIRVRFLSTCGAFIYFDWPEDVDSGCIGKDVWNPKEKAVMRLFEEGEKAVKKLLSGGLLSKLGEIADFITIGADSHDACGDYSVELVFLVNLKNGSIRGRTGKSYPTADQEKKLVRIKELETHFPLGQNEVLILGCHELKVFENRVRERAKEKKEQEQEEKRKKVKLLSPKRRNVVNEFTKLVKEKYRPTIILHHPHTTNKARTWKTAWSGLKKILEKVDIKLKAYASATVYYKLYEDEECAKKKKIRLCDVCEATKYGSVVDIVVRAEDCP